MLRNKMVFGAYCAALSLLFCGCSGGVESAQGEETVGDTSSALTDYSMSVTSWWMSASYKTIILMGPSSGALTRITVRANSQDAYSGSVSSNVASVLIPPAQFENLKSVVAEVAWAALSADDAGHVTSFDFAIGY